VASVQSIYRSIDQSINQSINQTNYFIGIAEIARPDIVRRDNAAPDQTVVLEHVSIEYAER